MTSIGYGDYLRFRDLVMQHSGLHYPEKKKRELEIGIQKALQSVPETVRQINPDLNLNNYANFLSKGKSLEARVELTRLINLLTIGETHFFRNSAHFKAMANTILPNLIAHKRAAAAAINKHQSLPLQLRLWSAGCATGEEPYSLAILLRQIIPDINNWRILILATDINQDSLKRAKNGVYSSWSFRETQAKALRSIYFTKQGKQYHLNNEIKQMVTFAPLNLIEEDFPAIHNNTMSMDLIICRNVTIYFTQQTTRKLVNKFYKSVLNGGWLITGHSEPAMEIYQDFSAHVFSNAILYQKQAFHPPPTSPRNQGKTLKLPPVNEGIDANAKRFFHQRFLHQRGGIQSAALGLHQLQFNHHPEIVEPVAPPDKNYYETARRLFSEGQINQAIEILQTHQNEIPKDSLAAANALLAHAYADKGQWEQARSKAQLAIEQNTLLAQAYYILALIEEQEGNFKQAITNYKKVIYLNRKEPLPYINLALLYKKTGKSKLAHRTLNNSIKILCKQTPDEIVTGSGGLSAKRLLKTATHLDESWSAKINNG